VGQLRGGVYGCGMISEFHLRAWRRIEQVEIVALANRTIGRAEARRDAFFPNANVYVELDDLLKNEELDFLDVLTPPAMHKQHCFIALDAGLHVICQKPIADDLNDARELVGAFEASGRSLAIHENHRYRPWYSLR
jgi:predicted dehydrogenase